MVLQSHTAHTSLIRILSRLDVLWPDDLHLSRLGGLVVVVPRGGGARGDGDPDDAPRHVEQHREHEEQRAPAQVDPAPMDGETNQAIDKYVDSERGRLGGGAK